MEEVLKNNNIDVTCSTYYSSNIRGDDIICKFVENQIQFEEMLKIYFVYIII